MAININTNLTNNLNGHIVDAENVKGGYITIYNLADADQLPEGILEVNKTVIYCMDSTWPEDWPDNVVEDYQSFEQLTDYISYYVRDDRTGNYIRVTEENMEDLDIIVGGEDSTPCYYSGKVCPPGFY